jgi:hypothetical protein
MVRNLFLKFAITIPIALASLNAQDADPIEAARQAKLAAEKAAAAAEAATGAAIEAAATKAAAGAREKIIAGREAEKARKLAEIEAAENAEIDAAAAAAGLEARRKLAAELGLELEEVPDSSIYAELDSLDNSLENNSVKSNPLQGFNFGLASSIGLASGEAFSNIPLGGTIVVSTPYGVKVGPLELNISLGAGGYTGKYDEDGISNSFNPIFAGIGANGIIAQFVFSETHVGLVGEGFGVRQFAGVTLERIMKNSFNLPFNLLIGGEGFISTNMTGGNNTSGWGGLGVRLDISL